MVKLVGNDTMEEIEAYFDYENNFPQLLEDYIKKSGEVEELFHKSKDNNRSHFNRVMKYQLKKLNEQNLDEDPPRIKLFKTWMSNLYEQKQMRYKKKDSDLEKDELIRNLKNELLKKDKSITNLENENYQHRKKINKLKKKIKDMEQVEVKPEPEPEPKPEPPQEPKIDSVYCNHLTKEEEEDKDAYEQNIKAQCEAIAREKEEHIENKNKIEKILETYYSQCDLKMDVIHKRFNKEVKKANRTKRSIKNDYIDEFEIYLEELRDEYLEEHDELSSYFDGMFDKPSRRFEDLLPSEMVQVQSIN